ncbi:MAG: DUF3570 domain-containing protein [Methylococcaceae bacterium]|nr:DUF3570 domain-containing protein [Methylococcaceae bacterium]
MAAINKDMSKALAALTTAALSLPGMDAQAGVPSAQAKGNVQYGYYQESGDRMKVEVYHGDFTLPVSDRLEFSFNVDRDTYSGATPAFSIPETMTNQVRYSGSQTGTVDVVSAASGGVTAQGLTTLGGLNTFKEVNDGIGAQGHKNDQAFASIQAQKDAEEKIWRDANPTSFAPTISGPTTLTFGKYIDMEAGVYGKSNMNVGVDCHLFSCYRESGFVIGTVYDPVEQSTHVHRGGAKTPLDRSLEYHKDSSGIYIRALNGEAFNLLNMDFNIDLDKTPGTGPDDYWEILGFNNAVNPNLVSGDGKNYNTGVAYQQVFNTHTGILALDRAFSNINAFWIHYHGYLRDVGHAPGNDFSVEIDDINLTSANFPGGTPPVQQAWMTQYASFRTALDKKYESQSKLVQAQVAAQTRQAMIELYRNFLNKAVPANTRIKQTFQQQPLETRTQPVFGAKYYFDDATLALSGGQSNEPDFRSTFGSANLSQELNNKLTTISAGYSYTSNEISRNTGAHSTSHHDSDPKHNPTNYPELHENSDANAFNLGLSQVLNKNALLQLSANYTRQSGYLSNPYKYVYVRGEITAEEYYALYQATSPGDINWNDITHLEVVGLELFREARPNLRNQFSFSTRLNQYLPAMDAALHMDYRYYLDDWGVDSHTMELKWLQKLPWGLTITPNLRYYSQSKADFFAPYFLAPRADGHYSSDFRLSGYGALSSGLTVSKQFNRGIRLELGMEYYSHQGNLKLGGGGESDYADFSYWMTHAGLSIDLSAPGNILGSGAGDHRHHHGAPAPAGVMFSHMMNEADGIMAGYRYMYANQTGDLWHGSSAISDAAVLGEACGAASCTDRPTAMSMQMHMLDLMYAPTDWLNLMLMPQVADMEMTLAPLAGATGESLHGGSHQTHDLGDTYAAALLKVFDHQGHHMHVSLGVSAPTGSVDETLSGQDNVLQDYGMQLGSGTWDFKPSVTYTGHWDDWSWGAQLSGTKRLENRNKSGYALGDQFQATAWGGYSISQWLSASIRGVYTEQGKIRGEFTSNHATSAPVDYTSNYGGKFWDAGFGLNLAVPDGAFAGHNFSVEWLQPVADKFNGYQLEREGSLFATWNYQF